MDKTRLSSGVFLAFIILGIFLATFNFLNNRSLWLDEASLALNITNKSTLELLQPLDYNQVAPIGFLLLEKAFASIGGNTDWSMRITPLFSFLLSVPLFYAISFQLNRKKDVAFFSTALFSLSYYPIYFSSEVKQYMSDVLMCLTIILAALLFFNRKSDYYYKLLAVGILSIWFSNVAVIPLFGVSLLLLHQTVKQKQEHLKTAFLLGSWLISFCCYYYFFIHHHPSRVHMVSYWENAGAFLPQAVFSRSFFVVLLDMTGTFFRLVGAGKFSVLAIPAYGLGLLFLLKRKKQFAYLFSAPIIIHLFLSYFRLYPFSSRLALYNHPLLLLTIAYGINLFADRLLPKRIQVFFLTAILFSSVLLLAIKWYPIEREEIKKSLAYLNDRIVATDQVYVYYPTVRSVLFYQKDFPTYASLSKDNIFLGKSHRENRSGYEDEIKALDQPVWLLFSHVYQNKKSGGSISEEEYIIERLKVNGFKIVDQQNYKGSSVYKAVPVSTGH